MVGWSVDQGVAVSGRDVLGGQGVTGRCVHVKHLEMWSRLYLNA